ncbi:hypothetical protein [uncultured Amnibacterium sp.]|uniref:hypothetical protein n=1 Tax=uncultured Amnibacterium sp. TaxID=1631851 RepID=UPI0035CBB9C8
MATPIEDTVPEVSDDVDAAQLAEIVDELATMNSDDWTTIAENGVAANALIEFAFSAPTEEVATQLVEGVRDDLGYAATLSEPQGELDDWTIRGTTSDVSVTQAGLTEWVRRLAAYGLDQDGSVLDGWAVLID